ncbi:SDR family NAD(P)-dependent oxidoreductase [Hydrogenophaga sp. BPS33]|uniref:SDR family NAD(P)-dependent oxidoreductase n=1 Tax=Hydrogenophaga sp. BPS33 TaxID=2651974 RepID=UPI00135AAB66|nr:SDR family NAD(P)-dependent oxidoreductase [Hydrogenophaga sp. BPS33]
MVTGAAHGIGNAIAVNLAEGGAVLALMDRDASALADLASQLRGSGARVETYVVDFTRRNEIDQVFSAIHRDLGQVDILVNNVGHSLREAMAPFETVSSEACDLMLDVCLKPAMACCQHVIPGMKARKGGKIINISSDSAFVGPLQNAPYAAAKAGIIGFTRAIARELAPFHINVNTVAPGYIRTRAMDAHPQAAIDRIVEQTPLGMLGDPEDIAHAVRFFASAASRFVTGQTLIVNGGRWFN